MTTRFPDNEAYDSATDKSINLFPPLEGYMISQADQSPEFSLSYEASSSQTHLGIMSYTDDQSSIDASHNNSPPTAAAPPPPPTNNMNEGSPDPAASSTSFNISWGGNDRPPTEVHPDEDMPMMTSKPLPKPRGVRRLPEPEPAEDGTIDEDVLKRRKNTRAARRSRLKKFLNVQNLEGRVSHLQSENAKLVLNNAVLESEKKSFLAKEIEYKKRIKQLENLIKGSESSPVSVQSNTSSEGIDAWVISQ
ncbi:hypothetical protein DFQ28_006236 [Apophysomyces sp. BC1034]|nr:hypothetical protein DFQ30_005445 [Apophysomyces sp. BC1015]KAG0177778.1 hypothetical protein DFQ29_004354 [Apophysomyces sp. BC1021]KAG0187544.1 hypothetical protein DFQ28_006236 [Apophysomyces sp. BC1034]